LKKLEANGRVRSIFTKTSPKNEFNLTAMNLNGSNLINNRQQAGRLQKP